jgi:serine/threonine kinase 16
MTAPHHAASLTTYCPRWLQRGNLQDMMSANSINSTHTPEKQMLELFRGACLAVREMHTFRSSKKPSGSASSGGNNKVSSSLGAGPSSIHPPSRSRSPIPDHEAHESHGLLNHPSADDDGIHVDDGDGEGYSYPQGATIPQVVDRMEIGGRANDVIFDGDAEVSKEEGGAAEGEGEGDIVPYAHRDIKPA